MSPEAKLRPGCGINPGLQRAASINFERQSAGGVDLQLATGLPFDLRMMKLDRKIGEMDFAASIATDCNGIRFIPGRTGDFTPF